MSEAPFRPVAALLQAMHTTVADRRWPLKIGLGGLWMLTIVGLVLPQGFVIEHLDNSRRGFSRPLPAWNQLSDKALMGLLALIIDFAFFFTPLLLGGILLICSLVPIILNVDVSWLPWLLVPVVGGCWLLSFGVSVVPVAKIHFAENGDLGQQLGWKAFQRTLSAPARIVYFQARLATLPAYLPAVASLWLLWNLLRQRDAMPALVLGCAWLAACALFWGWLVAGQVYLSAHEIVAERELDARIARHHQP